MCVEGCCVVWKSIVCGVEVCRCVVWRLLCGCRCVVWRGVGVWCGGCCVGVGVWCVGV